MLKIRQLNRTAALLAALVVTACGSARAADDAAGPSDKEKELIAVLASEAPASFMEGVLKRFIQKRCE